MPVIVISTTARICTSRAAASWRPSRKALAQRVPAPYATRFTATCSPNSATRATDEPNRAASAEQAPQREQGQQQHPDHHRAPYQADHAAQVAHFGLEARGGIHVIHLVTDLEQ